MKIPSCDIEVGEEAGEGEGFAVVHQGAVELGGVEDFMEDVVVDGETEFTEVVDILFGIVTHKNEFSLFVHCGTDLVLLLVHHFLKAVGAFGESMAVGAFKAGLDDSSDFSEGNHLTLSAFELSSAGDEVCVDEAEVLLDHEVTGVDMGDPVGTEFAGRNRCEVEHV